MITTETDSTTGVQCTCTCLLILNYSGNSFIIISRGDPENSERGGRDTCPLASYIDAFYFSENSIKILVIQNFKEKGVAAAPWPTPKSALDFYYIHKFVKLILHDMTLLHVMCLQKPYDRSCLMKIKPRTYCLVTDLYTMQLV